MKQILTALLLFAASLSFSQIYKPQIVTEGPKAAVYSEQAFLGNTPYNKEIDMMQVGKVYVVGEEGIYKELTDEELKSSKPIKIPRAAALALHDLDINFEGLTRNGNAVVLSIGFGSGYSSEDVSTALERFAQNNRLFSSSDTAKYVLSGFQTSSKSLAKYGAYKTSSYATISQITWKLTVASSGKVIFEESVGGGHYLGSLKGWTLSDQRENKSYSSKMAAVSSLERLLRSERFIEALQTKPSLSVNSFDQLSVIGIDGFCANLTECMSASVTVDAGQSFGSGFIISDDGFILTNHHVVSSVNEPTIHLSNGLKTSAKVIRTNEEADVALLKIELSGLPYFKLATESSIELGATVKTIGTPESKSLGHSLTQGIISGFRPGDVNMIQTDLSINRGNSGGPLFSDNMEVLGIVTSKLFGVGTEGVNFSIAIGDALKALNIE